MKINDPFPRETNIQGILESALLSVPFPIVLLQGRELRIIYVNDALLEIWGKKRDILGQTLVEVVPEVQGQPFPELLKNVFMTGIAYTDREAAAYVHKNGSLVPVYFDYSYTAIRDQQQTITGVMVMCREVTEQVLAKRHAQESDSRLRDTILQAPIAMALIKGPDFIIDIANEASMKLWNRSHEMIGKRVIEVFPEVKEQGFLAILNNVYQSGKPFYGNEMPVQLKNTTERLTVIINFVFHPIFENNEVSSIMMLGYDVTELVQARKRAEESELNALDAHRSLEIALVKKDEFIGLASHELKTPLTSITGYLQVLERAQTDERNKGFVGKAVQQVKKLTDLVSDLLDVSKIEAGRLRLSIKPADIREILFESIELIKHSHDLHHIKLETEVSQLMVPVDKNRIEQVMINLLTNAIKYAPSSATIQVRLTATPDDVKVEVIDFGMGIAPDQQKKIFTKFHRIDEINPVISGLGIGLYISKEIIDRHSGQLWVESEMGKGSRFCFTLPL